MNLDLFNPSEGQQLKAKGMAKAARRTPLALRQARLYARHLARTQGTVTSDDVYKLLDDVEARLLGNAAGSIFKGDAWVFVDWVPSERKTNHGRMIRRWRLR